MVPDTFAPQQRKADAMKQEMMKLIQTIAEQEAAAHELAKHSDDKVFAQLAAALEKSNRIMEMCIRDRLWIHIWLCAKILSHTNASFESISQTDQPVTDKTLCTVRYHRNQDKAIILINRAYTD